MCFFGGRSFSQGIYDLSIVIQTNESVQLKKFKGKKVLVAVFPESKQANEFMADIDSFCRWRIRSDEFEFPLSVAFHSD